MKMELLVPLAFLTDNTWSFFAMDIILYVLLILVLYFLFITGKVSKGYDKYILWKQKQSDFILWAKTLLILQGIIMLIQLVLFIFKAIPIKLISEFVVIDNNISIQCALFTISNILRILNISIICSFLYMCFHNKNDRDQQIVLYIILLCSIMATQLFFLLYNIFPSLNHELSIYETFYRIVSKLYTRPSLHDKKEYIAEERDNLLCEIGGQFSTKDKNIITKLWPFKNSLNRFINKKNTNCIDQK